VLDIRLIAPSGCEGWESDMAEVYPVPADWAANDWIDDEA
jgi:hypothetical protein